MKTNVNELSGAALDWAVAKVAEQPLLPSPSGDLRVTVIDGIATTWSPSTNWHQGGPLIERYEVAISPETHGWEAEVYDGGDINPVDGMGMTPLIAACRAIVCYVVGTEIDIPDELGGGQ